MQDWMIYGANGYTARLAAEEAKRRGARPILAGRTASAIEPMGVELGLPTRVFGLDDPAAAARGLEGVGIVLNCAGPFSATHRPMLEACVRARTHYLDITGEIAVFEYVHTNSARWREAGILAMPGVGFDVVPSDCLAAMLKRELPTATHLRLAFRSKHGKLSPGTTKTMIEGLPEGGKVRRDGRIVAVPAAYKVEQIPFLAGESFLAVTIPWGDVSTAYYSTGIPNIEVFMGTSPRQLKQMKTSALIRPLLGLSFVQNYMKNQVTKKVKGPSEEQRANDEMQLWGEATDAAGNRAALRMRTPEGYHLTYLTALRSVEKLLETPPTPGAATPSMAFGADFVTGIPGVTVERA